MTSIGRADIWIAFENMRIKHPRMDQAHKLYDDLRRVKRETPYSPQRFGTIFAPTHSGKSMTIRHYIEKYVVDEAIARGHFSSDQDRAYVAAKQRIVLHVSLSEAITPSKLCTDILQSLGDPRAASGSPEIRTQRYYDAMRGFGTELVVIDEIQHLSNEIARSPDDRFAKSGAPEDTSVSDKLKIMLIRGLVPMVFIGIDEARSHLMADGQLAGREAADLDFGRLNPSIPADMKLFEDYCGRLGLKLKQHGIFDEPVDLLREQIPACLLEAATGRLGIASRVVEQGAVIAKEKGDSTVHEGHLADAIDHWPHKEKLEIDYNPFRTGVRSVELRCM